MPENRLLAARPVETVERLSRHELARDLERVAAGDVAAFTRLYRSTSTKLFGVVIRILGRGNLAEEVLQEVYLRVWQRAKDYSAAQASPITWLVAIARNRALDEVRRRGHRMHDDVMELLELPSDEDVIGEHIERDELRRLRDCLDRLDPAHREVVQLIYFEGVTRDGVAARVGQPVATVKTWLSSSLRQLKGCLDP